MSHVNKSKNKLAVKICKHGLAVNSSLFGVQKRLKLLQMWVFVYVIESIKPSVYILTKTFFFRTIFYDSVVTLITVREIRRLHTIASLIPTVGIESTLVSSQSKFLSPPWSVVRSRRILKSLITLRHSWTLYF